jgi:hypothetical protein
MGQVGSLCDYFYFCCVSCVGKKKKKKKKKKKNRAGVGPSQGPSIHRNKHDPSGPELRFSTYAAIYDDPPPPTGRSDCCARAWLEPPDLPLREGEDKKRKDDDDSGVRGKSESKHQHH